ncbi:MAG: 1-(5-phosphoribosyl)-5-[(5-phosphoribosylamino)methylideneamino] imidazole-4-carboxamide isomerase [Nitrososphaerota archaeon]|nr:1-(5-phosphoribosyl)-5-[(5-phosphoribosylamino)methylideneamino] imidazole-4-carboxamide isomerase [Nitrososphaerota archaeon]
MKVWAAIDIRGGKTVTAVKGDIRGARSWGLDPLDAAAKWEREGADGLHIVDLDAASGSGTNSGAIGAIAEKARIPVQVGGGIRDLAAADRLLSLGADRVIVGTLAYRDPASVGLMLERLGRERVVVAVDYRGGRVVTEAWTRTERVGVEESVGAFEAMGVAAVLATSADRDGTAGGPDVESLKRIRGLTRMEVLASGGIRDDGDLDALAGAGVDGAVVGLALYQGRVRLGCR